MRVGSMLIVPDFVFGTDPGTFGQARKENRPWGTLAELTVV